MTNRLRCFLAATVACLSLSGPALAASAGAVPAGIESAIAMAATQADIATADEQAAMGFGKTDAFATHPVYRHDPRLELVADAQPDAADAFEVRVDRAVKAAVDRALIPAMRTQAAQDAAKDASSARPQVVYLQAPAASAPADGTVLGIPFEQLVTVLATILVPLLLGLGTLIWKGNATAKEAKIAQWIQAAYLITEEVSRLTPNTVDDKVAYALRVLTERLQAAGIAATPTIAEQARATWTAMSGSEKVEASVRAKAVALAAEKATATESAARPQTPLAA